MMKKVDLVMETLTDGAGDLENSATSDASMPSNTEHGIPLAITSHQEMVNRIQREVLAGPVASAIALHKMTRGILANHRLVNLASRDLSQSLSVLHSSGMLQNHAINLSKGIGLPLMGAIDVTPLQSSAIASAMIGLRSIQDSLRAQVSLSGAHFSEASASILASVTMVSGLESLVGKNHLVNGFTATHHLLRGFSEVAVASTQLLASFSNRPDITSLLSLGLQRAPALNTYAAATAISTTIDPDRSALDGMSESEQALLEISSSLEVRLASVSTDLPELYRGARAAIVAGGPDRARHFSISARELVTHLLHLLAPDSELVRWSTDPTHLVDGRPTRRARVSYIVNELAEGEYRQFADVDADNALALLNYLQDPTHRLAPTLGGADLRMFFRRTEATLSLLLEAAGY